MSERAKREKAKRAKTKEERVVKEEAAEVTRPSAEEKGVEEEPRVEVEETREPAAEMPSEEAREEREETREPVAEIPPEEALPAERPLLKHTILMQCMQVPSFRTRVIYYLVKKLR